MLAVLRGPWALSAYVHGLLVLLFLLGYWNLLPPPPATIKMHLGVSGTSRGQDAPASSAPPLLPYSPHGLRNETTMAEWQTAFPIHKGSELSKSLQSQSASLEELLAGVSLPASLTQLPTAGWGIETKTDGHELPPLPSPSLIPSQGARWALVFSVPGAGGFASSIEGLGEGNPELDRWLETWLRDATFPASPNGEPYTLRWTLVLEVGRPE
jgi:hypothetical protein